MFTQLLNGRSASDGALSAARGPRRVRKLQTFCHAAGNSASSCRKRIRFKPQAVPVSHRSSEDERPRIIVVKLESWKNGRSEDRIRFPTSLGGLSRERGAIASGGLSSRTE